MDFLLKYGLTDDDIKEITNRNGEAIVKNIELNKNNVKYYEIGYRNYYENENRGMFYHCSSELIKNFEKYKENLEIGVMVDTTRFDISDFVGVYNDNIDTGVIDITVDTESKKNTSVMNYQKPWWQYDNWNFNYLRNVKNIEELKAKFMSRLYGNYFIITITFSDSVRRIEFETLDCKLINNRTI